MDELQPITNVLDEYQSNKLFSLDLRRDLIGQDPSFDTYQEIDDNGDLPEDVKQMEIEGKFLNTLDYDLISYESYFSAVQFNWVEAAVKEKFIASAILDEDGLKCSYDEIQRLNEPNLEYEKKLVALQQSIAADDERKILQIAQEIEDRYTSAQATFKLGRALTNDIADLELELNELKMSQKGDDVELMTITEATEAAGELERQLMEMTTKLSDNNQQIPKLKAQYPKESKLVDQLRIERNAIEKAEGHRRRTLGGRIKGNSIVKLESCRKWLTSVSRTYKAVQSILSIDVSGANLLSPTKLQVKFGLRRPLIGILVVEFANSPALGTQIISSAYLDQSSQDISTVVQRAIQDNDLCYLILAVLHFLSCLQSSLPEQ